MPFLVFKIIGITFFKPEEAMLDTGESLSSKSKKYPVLENNHIYIQFVYISSEIVVRTVFYNA